MELQLTQPAVAVPPKQDHALSPAVAQLSPEVTNPRQHLLRRRLLKIGVSTMLFGTVFGGMVVLKTELMKDGLSTPQASEKRLRASRFTIGLGFMWVAGIAVVSILVPGVMGRQWNLRRSVFVAALQALTALYGFGQWNPIQCFFNALPGRYHYSSLLLPMSFFKNDGGYVCVKPSSGDFDVASFEMMTAAISFAMALLVVVIYICCERNNPESPYRVSFMEANSKHTFIFASAGVLWVGLLLALSYYFIDFSITTRNAYAGYVGVFTAIFVTFVLYRILGLILAWEKTVLSDSRTNDSHTHGCCGPFALIAKCRACMRSCCNLLRVGGRFFYLRFLVQELAFEVVPQLIWGLPKVATLLDRHWFLAMVVTIALNCTGTVALILARRYEAAVLYDLVTDVGFIVINVAAFSQHTEDVVAAQRAAILRDGVAYINWGALRAGASLLCPLLSISLMYTDLYALRVKDNVQRALESKQQRRGNNGGAQTLIKRRQSARLLLYQPGMGAAAAYLPSITSRTETPTWLQRHRAHLAKAAILFLVTASSLAFVWYFVSLVVLAEEECKANTTAYIWNHIIEKRVYFDQNPWNGETTCPRPPARFYDDSRYITLDFDPGRRQNTQPTEY